MDLSIIPSVVKETAKTIGNNVGTAVETLKPIGEAVSNEVVNSAKNVGKLAKYGLSIGPASLAMSKETKKDLRKDFEDLDDEDKAWAVVDAVSLIPGIGTATKAVAGTAKAAVITAKTAKAAKTVNKGAKVLKARETFKAAEKASQAKRLKEIARATRKDDLTQHKKVLSDFFGTRSDDAAEGLRNLKKNAAIRDQVKLTTRKLKAESKTHLKNVKEITKQTRKYNNAHKATVAEAKRKYGDVPKHLKTQLAKDLSPYATVQVVKNNTRKKKKKKE